MTSNKKTLLHLSLIKGIGPAVIQRIAEQAAGLLTNIYSYSQSDFISLGLSSKLAESLYVGLQHTDELQKEIDLIAKHAVNICTIFDETYPALLKHIHNPPPLLYYQGMLPDHDQCMAIVGSRDANYYGKEVVSLLVPQLVEHNWVIISGGALGADTFAHQETIKNNGKTVAILGSGLLRPYPHSNKKLFASIIETGGALVSSFPLQAEPQPSNFPARNRIIAGMSRGCIVIQAKEKSGARITAQWALEQGRDVFAVPGLITEPLSAGCHALIGEGAKLVNSAQDVLQEYDQHMQQLSIQDVESKLAPVEQTILAACTKPVSIDDLVMHTGLSLRDLQMYLCTMQLNNVVMQNMAGLWERV